MYSLALKKILNIDEIFESLRDRILQQKYDLLHGEGFHVTECDERFLSAYYIYDEPVILTVYEVDSDEFKKVEQRRQEYIFFSLDCDSKTIDICGNRNKSARLINAIGKVTEYKIEIDDVMIKFSRIISMLNENSISYQVNRVKIKDYPFLDNVLGDCTLNTENYSETKQLLSKFENNINQISITINFNIPITFVFHKSGVISIYKDMNSIDSSDLNLVKKCVL